MTGIICCIHPSKVGDQPPLGYSDRHNWANVQLNGGLRQARCPRCGKFRFPQEPCREKGRCPT